MFTATKLKEACYMLVDTPEQLTILENQSEMFRSVLEHTNVIESTCSIKYLFVVLLIRRLRAARHVTCNFQQIQLSLKLGM